MADKLPVTKKKNSTYHELRRGLTIVLLFSPIILFAFWVIGSYFWNRLTQPNMYMFYDSDTPMLIAGLVLLFVLMLFLRRLRYVVSWRRGLFAELRRTAHIREAYLAEQDEDQADDFAGDDVEAAETALYAHHN